MNGAVSYGVQPADVGAPRTLSPDTEIRADFDLIKPAGVVLKSSDNALQVGRTADTRKA
jgi:hypothetical protein